MEQKDRYLIMIFSVVTIMSYALGQMIMIPAIIDTSYMMMLFLNYLSPILLFIAFYLIGKKFEVRTNLKSLIVTLLIGAYLGNLLSYLTQFLYFEYTFSWESAFYILVPLQFIYTFFVSFSALAIANFEKNH